MDSLSLYLRVQRVAGEAETARCLKRAYKHLASADRARVGLVLHRMGQNDELRNMKLTEALEILAKIGLVLSQ